MQLQVETTNVCNADCVFCEYSRMSRPKGTMAMDLFRRIIDEAAIIPQFDHITITGLGETLLDRFLLDRIRYVRSLLPRIQFDLYTNGTYLRPAMTDALIAAGISDINVSLNAATADKRKQVMKLDDWPIVTANIRYAIGAVRSTSVRLIVKAVVAKDLMEDSDQNRFIEMFNGPVEAGGNAFLHLEGNWAGAVWPMRTLKREACPRALNQFMVLWDGRVSLCCFDGDGREILGDLNYQTIRQVFNGERALFIRTAHHEGRRNEVSLCAGCTGI